MTQLTISQVADQIRLRPSAIRYYERIGLLPPAERLSGQRGYHASVLYRLAIIQRARQLGFSLSKIRHLFFGFRDVTRPRGTLGKTDTKKACGTGSVDGWDKSSACLAQEVDDEVPLRHLGSMWQGHISEYG